MIYFLDSLVKPTRFEMRRNRDELVEIERVDQIPGSVPRLPDEENYPPPPPVRLFVKEDGTEVAYPDLRAAIQVGYACSALMRTITEGPLDLNIRLLRVKELASDLRLRWLLFDQGAGAFVIPLTAWRNMARW